VKKEEKTESLSLEEINHSNMSNSSTPSSPSGEAGSSLARPFAISERQRTQQMSSGGNLESITSSPSTSLTRVVSGGADNNNLGPASPSSVASPGNANGNRGRERQRDGSVEVATPVRCINPASDVNSRLDTQVEVRVYPCNNSQGGGKKKFTTFTIKPEVSLELILMVERMVRICFTSSLHVSGFEMLPFKDRCFAFSPFASLLHRVLFTFPFILHNTTGSHNPRIES
jgi:hypothetical protein